MAEGDRFERAFGAGWRSAYRRAREGVAPPEEVADKLVESLAKTLREEEGVPGFLAMEETLGHAAWRLALHASGVEEAAILLDAFGTLEGIARDLNGHRHAMVAADVAKSLLVQQGKHTGNENSWPTPSRFAENICAALIEHSFFATARNNLVAEGKFTSHEQARDWEHHIQRILQPAIQQIAEKLIRAPDAKALRAPNRIVKRQPTSELLGDVLVSIEAPSGSAGR